MARIPIDFYRSQESSFSLLVSNASLDPEVTSVTLGIDFEIMEPPSANDLRAKAGNTKIVLGKKEGGKIKGNLPEHFYYDRLSISELFADKGITFSIPNIATVEEVKEEVYLKLKEKQIYCVKETDIVATVETQPDGSKIYTLDVVPDCIGFFGQVKITDEEFIFPDVLYGFKQPDYGNF